MREVGWWSDQDTSAYKWPKYDSRKWVKLCLKYTVESTMIVVQAQCWTQAPQNWWQPSLYFTRSHQFSASLARGIPFRDAFGWKGIPSPAEATHGYAVPSSEQVLKKVYRCWMNPGISRGSGTIEKVGHPWINWHEKCKTAMGIGSTGHCGGGWSGGSIAWLRRLAAGEQRQFFTPSSIEPFGEGAGAHGREVWICTISVGMFLQLEEENILGFDLKNLRSFEVSILWGISNVPHKEKPKKVYPAQDTWPPWCWLEKSFLLTLFYLGQLIFLEKIVSVIWGSELILNVISKTLFPVDIQLTCNIVKIWGITI